MLLGDEAIAQGALDAGLSGCYAYPGTPSTEITEYVQASVMARQNKVRSDWASNEKTAMEAALGMSYAGKRALVCMKHVGLNVAADPFLNSAVTGANGGLVYAIADDPSMHSSQNEQDTRYYGKFAMIPVLEPANQQEAYDMAYYGFELSEKFQVPVVLRLTTRLAHSRAGIRRKEVQKQNELKLPGNPLQFILLPNMARKSYNHLLALQLQLGRLLLHVRLDLLDLNLDQLLVDVGLAVWRWRLELRRIAPELRRVLEAGQRRHLLERVAQLGNVGQRVLRPHGRHGFLLHLADLAQHHHPLCVSPAAQGYGHRDVHVRIPDPGVHFHEIVVQADHARLVLVRGDVVQDKLIQALNARLSEYPSNHLNVLLCGAYSGRHGCRSA